MYEEQFGFNKRPFRATPRGAEVFVGPQTAQTMQSLKKALTTSDGVVTVTGPAGSGKTTQVLRALEAIDANCTCIRIGRMHLGPDEILEFLLAKLGVQSPPASTIRRVVFFRAAVMKQRLAGHRVFIVVEDAQRLGLDALAELEALTGAENGDGDGANLVLMAPQSLKPLLRSEGLERLDQRVRLRHRVAALTEPELRAYMKHCFRLAGAEFDLIFTDGATKQLYTLSSGIPRVANNLTESVLTAAAERGNDKIGPDLVSEIAGAEYEMTVETRVPSFDEPETPVAEDAAPADEPVVEEAASDEPVDDAPMAEQEISEEQIADAPEVEQPIADEPVADEPAAEVAAELSVSDEVAEEPEAPVADAAEDALAESEPDIAVQPEAVEATTIVNDDPVDGIPLDDAPAVPEAPAALTLEPEAQAAAVSEPEPALEDASAAAETPKDDEFEVPELIQDTLPDLAILAPEVMEQSAITDAEMDAEEIPTLYSSMRMKAPLAEPAELSDEEDGKVFIGNDAEPLPTAEPEAAVEAPAAEEPALDPLSLEMPDVTAEAADVAPATDLEPAEAIPTIDPVPTAAEAPPVLDVEAPPVPEPKPAAEPPPVATAPASEHTEPVAGVAAPAGPDVLAAAQVEPAANPGEVPAWDRDPTLAELRPDIEALEMAMADLSDKTAPPPVKKKEEPVPEVELKDPTMPSLPEITLDAAIEEKIREAEEALEKHDATIAEDEESPFDADLVADEERDTRADAELEKIAEGLARAKTIEDVDDKMAETLFGEEISLIAAQVTLAKPANEPVAEGQPAVEEAPAAAEAPAVPAVPAAEESPAPAEPESEFEKEFREVYGENVDISLETKPKPGMDLSASQRLATVRALNAGIVQPPPGGAASPEAPSQSGPMESPASIEDQIDTSLSQTIKTLNIDGATLIDDDDDDDDENEGKRGFFSRFRRS